MVKCFVILLCWFSCFLYLKSSTTAADECKSYPSMHRYLIRALEVINITLFVAVPSLPYLCCYNNTIIVQVQVLVFIGVPQESSIQLFLTNSSIYEPQLLRCIFEFTNSKE